MTASTSDRDFAPVPSPEPGRWEPSEVEPTAASAEGPSGRAGGALRASDADREKVATLLSAAYAEGRITHEEHDERLGQVLGARTFDDLVPLTADLVPVDPTPTLSSGTPRYDVASATPGDEPDRMLAVFGGVERRGTWRIRRRTQAYALFGGIDLDLRDAVFEAPVVEISGFWCFGGLEIKVPAGMQVQDQTAGIFGGTDVRDLGEPVEGAPTLVIKGMTLFGGVAVKGPRPTREERRQRRTHRGCR